MSSLAEEGMTDWIKMLSTVELMLNATFRRYRLSRWHTGDEQGYPESKGRGGGEP